MEMLIVTGMSGAGKTQVINALEDIGYFCVDNVPPSMLTKFAELPGEGGKIERIALVVDVRSHGMFSDLMACLEDLRHGGFLYRILFLDCADNILAARYKETRRRHPLQTGEHVSIREAIAAEREMLIHVSRIADYLIESTMLSAGGLRQRVREMFAGEWSGSMVITCMSFGFKFGPPADADLVFDVRCLPNPFYVEGLKDRVGTDAPVREYVLSFETARGLRDKLLDLLDYLVPLYVQEGKSQLVIAIGCTGGKHRSVVFAELMAAHFKESGRMASVSHRDIVRK